jgi:putative ABC transport system substrate-binding protein
VNNRRKLMVALGASALVVPLRSFAQQRGKVWRIGFLLEGEQSHYVSRLEAFKVGMRDLAYVEGWDYVLEHRYAQLDFGRLPALAAELLSLNVNIIVAPSTPSAESALKLTREIPILVAAVNDPVGSGFAVTLARPGGNITGLTNGVASDLFSKRLDLLRQIVPGMHRVGFLYNPDNAGDAQGLRQFESDCTKFGFKPLRGPVRRREEIAMVFNTLHRDKAQGLMVSAAPTNQAWRESITEHAARNRLSAVYSNSIYVDSGACSHMAPTLSTCIGASPITSTKS